MKVNTIAVIVLNTYSRTRNHQDANIFQRRLDEDNIRKAYSSVTLYVLAGLAGCMVLCLQDISLTDALFEAFSAIGTVGLSRGLTASLPAVSKVMILLLMFMGRVGSMSVAMAITPNQPQPKVRNVAEKILIG